MTNALILGSTGEVGKQALLAALASPEFAKVYSFGRSPPKNVSDATPGRDKLVHTALDYDKVFRGDAAEAAKLRDVGAEAVLIALGTTRANAGGAEQFKLIDREYVLAAAKAARVEGKEQAVVYCSSAGSSASSTFLYPSSKGLTEQGLAALGYAKTVIMRPGYLQVPGGRGEGRLVESIFGAAMKIPSLISSSVASPTPAVARAMVHASLKSQDDLAKLGVGHAEDSNGHAIWAFSNSDILKAAK